MRFGHRQIPAWIALALGLLLTSVALLPGVTVTDERTRPSANRLMPLSCSGGSIGLGHLSVDAGAGCGSGGFGAEWSENPGQWNSTASYNFSFSLVAVTEVTPAGAIDELSPILWAPTGSTSVARSPSEVNFTVNETAPVAPTSGPWYPGTTFGAESTWAPWSGSWLPGNASTGNVSMRIVFHLLTGASNNSTAGTTNNSANATGAGSSAPSYSLKFDFAVLNWPWVNADDHLGLVMDAISAGGAHFVFNRSTGNLTQQWNDSGRPVVSLLLGPQANATRANGSSEPLGVTSEAYLWPNASTPRHLYGNISYGFDAYVLINFTGQNGGYQSLTYDPWIVFHVGSSSPSSTPARSEGGFGTLTAERLIGAATIGAATLAVALLTIRARRRARSRVEPPEPGRIPPQRPP